MKMIFRSFLCICLIVLLIPVFSGMSPVYPDKYQIYAADPSGSINVKVGYLGTKYVTKKTYTATQLRDLGTTDQLFTYVDSMPAPVLQAARGVTLVNILKDAGIDPASVQRYDFRAGDGKQTNQEFTSQSLISTARYYYPNLISKWNKDTGKPEFGAEEGRIKVETVIALEQYTERYGENEEAAWNKLHVNRGYRLCFGMVSANDALGSRDSVYKITSIDCLLVGSPPDDFEGIDKDKPSGSKDDNKNNTGKNKGTDNKDKKKDGSKSDKNKSDKDKDKPDKEKDVSKKDKTEPEETSEAAIGEGDSALGIRGANATDIGSLSSTDIKMLLRAGAGSKLTKGDKPWNIYEISPDSEPLPPQKPDPKAVAVISSLLGSAFSAGALMAFRRYRYRFK